MVENEVKTLPVIIFPHYLFSGDECPANEAAIKSPDPFFIQCNIWWSCFSKCPKVLPEEVKHRRKNEQSAPFLCHPAKNRDCHYSKKKKDGSRQKSSFRIKN